jgi:hypothetical protein
MAVATDASNLQQKHFSHKRNELDLFHVTFFKMAGYVRNFLGTFFKTKWEV